MEDSSLSTDWLRVVYTADYFPSLGRLWPQKAGEGIGLNAEKLLLEMVMMGLTCIPCEPGDCLSVACVNIRRPHGHLSLLGHREQLLQTRWARRGGGGHGAAGRAGIGPGAAAPLLPPTWQRLPRPPHVLPARRRAESPATWGAWPPPAFGALHRSCPPIGCERRGPAPAEPRPRLPARRPLPASRGRSSGAGVARPRPWSCCAWKPRLEYPAPGATRSCWGTGVCCRTC